MSTATETWLLWRSGPGAAAFNMAADATLLEQGASRASPILRFYSWTEPAASFGYFQNYEEIARLTPLRPLVRRPTGGGLVPHDGDWTYSLVFPPSHWWYSLSATESYRRVHAWLQSSFARMGRETNVADAAQKTGAGQCFAGHEKFDLLWRGIKIAGAAQRRSRTGLLIQGSLQPPEGMLSRGDWESALCAAGEKEMGVSWQDYETGADFNRLVEELAEGIYAKPEQVRLRRGKGADGRHQTIPPAAP